MSRRMVWLSTPTTLRVCSSVAQAVTLGAPGDHVHADDADGLRPAARPSHVIRATRTGRKIAVRLATGRRAAVATLSPLEVDAVLDCLLGQELAS